MTHTHVLTSLHPKCPLADRQAEAAARPAQPRAPRPRRRRGRGKIENTEFVHAAAVQVDALRRRRLGEQDTGYGIRTDGRDTGYMYGRASGYSAAPRRCEEARRHSGECPDRGGPHGRPRRLWGCASTPFNPLCPPLYPGVGLLYLVLHNVRKTRPDTRAHVTSTVIGRACNAPRARALRRGVHQTREHGPRFH